MKTWTLHKNDRGKYYNLICGVLSTTHKIVEDLKNIMYHWGVNHLYCLWCQRKSTLDCYDYYANLARPNWNELVWNLGGAHCLRNIHGKWREISLSLSLPFLIPPSIPFCPNKLGYWCGPFKIDTKLSYYCIEYVYPILVVVFLA